MNRHTHGMSQTALCHALEHTAKDSYLAARLVASRHPLSGADGATRLTMPHGFETKKPPLCRRAQNSYYYYYYYYYY